MEMQRAPVLKVMENAGVFPAGGAAVGVTGLEKTCPAAGENHRLRHRLKSVCECIFLPMESANSMRSSILTHQKLTGISGRDTRRANGNYLTACIADTGKISPGRRPMCL